MLSAYMFKKGPIVDSHLETECEVMQTSFTSKAAPRKGAGSAVHGERLTRLGADWSAKAVDTPKTPQSEWGNPPKG